MKGALSAAAILLLGGSSWTLGTLVLSRMNWSELHPHERAALRLTAGLGLTALVIAGMTLLGWFAYTPSIVAALAAIAVLLLLRGGKRARPPAPIALTRPPAWASISLAAVIVCAVLACLGAVAPVTDDDALAYVIPIAQRIADHGALRVWTDQARSMWPQSQQVLLAFTLRLGGDRLGALTAFEFLLAIGVISALARRVCERSEHIGPALIIALGSPVVAFQIASAKEDLLLLAASAAAGFCLAGDGSSAEFAAAGLFAGIAAGAKYPGLGILIAAVAWPLIAQRGRRWRSAAIVALCALASGGLWYALNLWRYGNPVAPFVFGARGTPLTPAVVRAFEDSYGGGRGLIKFFVAPIRIFLQPLVFTGRLNLFNPLAYAGLLGLFLGSARRSRPLFFISAMLYVGWFFSLQNARLLLPAVVLLAPAAADRLVPFALRRRSLEVLGWTVAFVSIGIVAAIGAVRFERYALDPAGFLAQSTANYADIQWINSHLDRRHDRLGSNYKEVAYIEVPTIPLDSSYEIEISEDELEDPKQMLDACRRQGITHLYSGADSFPDLRDQLRVIYQNPASLQGGTHFFRKSPTEATAVFEIIPLK